LLPGAKGEKRWGTITKEARILGLAVVSWGKAKSGGNGVKEWGKGWANVGGGVRLWAVNATMDCWERSRGDEKVKGGSEPTKALEGKPQG